MLDLRRLSPLALIATACLTAQANVIRLVDPSDLGSSFGSDQPGAQIFLYTLGPITPLCDIDCRNLNMMRYSPEWETLYIPGAPYANVALRLPTEGQATSSWFDIDSARYSFSMHVSQGAEFDRGVFSIFGAVPALGIASPSLLLRQSVVAAEVSYDGTGPSASPSISFLLRTEYADPLLGFSSNYMRFTGYIPSGGPLLDAPSEFSRLFTVAWAGGNSDYWSMSAVSGPRPVQVPEPSTLMLMIIALLAMAHRAKAVRGSRSRVPMIGQIRQESD